MIEKLKKDYNIIITIIGVVAAGLILPTLSGLIELIFSDYSTEGTAVFLIKYGCLFLANIVLAINAHKKNTNVVLPMLLFFLGIIVEDVYLLMNDMNSKSFIYLLFYAFIIIMIFVLNYSKDDKKRKCLYILYTVLLISLGFFLASAFSGAVIGLSNVLSVLAFITLTYLDYSAERDENSNSYSE